MFRIILSVVRGSTGLLAPHNVVHDVVFSSVNLPVSVAAMVVADFLAAPSKSPRQS